MPKPQGGKAKWWTTFQTTKFPAYVTLVDPPSLADLDLRHHACRVQRVLLDDILDSSGYAPGRQPSTIDLHQGACVLVLPEEAKRVTASVVPPPWLCRVDSIWYVPHAARARQVSPAPSPSQQQQQQQQQQQLGGRKKAKSLVSVDEDDVVAAWERQQLEQGRVPVHHFQLQVTYFYRWPDLCGEVRSSPAELQRLYACLVALGICDSNKAAARLLERRGAGGAPPTQHTMRFVAFSNHRTVAPTSRPSRSSSSEAATSADDASEDDEPEEAGDYPVPMESVMGPAHVLCLPSGASLPHKPASPAVATPELGAGGRPLPPAQLAALRARHVEEPPGFICVTFLLKQPDSGVQLLGLQEWAQGSAHSSLTGAWVARSRQQAQQMLASTAAELAAGGFDSRQQRKRKVVLEDSDDDADAAPATSAGVSSPQQAGSDAALPSAAAVGPGAAAMPAVCSALRLQQQVLGQRQERSGTETSG